MGTNNKYQSLDEKINEYFLLCDSLNEGKKSIVKPYTLSGLLCHLEMTREELEKLSGTARKRTVLTRAKAKIEAFIEENMLTGALSCNASLNSLKYSFNWGERSGDDDGADTRHITVTLSPEMSELAR